MKFLKITSFQIFSNQSHQVIPNLILLTKKKRKPKNLQTLTIIFINQPSSNHHQKPDSSTNFTAHHPFSKLCNYINPQKKKKKNQSSHRSNPKTEIPRNSRNRCMRACMRECAKLTCC